MTASTESTLTLNELLAIAKRRAWLLITVFLAGAVIAGVVIQHLPPRYRSAATVSVESQQIPEGLVQSTVIGLADERIGFIQQRVMTNARLIEVIDKLRLFPDQRDKLPESVLVAKFREHVFLETIRDPAVARGGIVAFQLGFEDGDPEIAAAVANELVGMFLEENVRSRTARATETTEFLKREAARIGEQVASMDAKVAAFKQEHGDLLPEHLELRMGMLQGSEANLKSIEREIMALEEELRFLEVQRVSPDAASLARAAADRPSLSPAQQLAALKVELVEKTAIYAPAHPDLQWLKRKIALLEQTVTETSKSESRLASGVDTARARIESQIASANARLESLRAEKRELGKKIVNLQQEIIATPEVERELKELTRDYDTARTEYDEIRSKQRDAELAENLEAQEKAERFVLLEPPPVPSVPAWPEKKKAYAMGFVLAAGGGAGTAFLAEVLDKSIRGPAMLTSILQRHPLAVIPFIESSADRRRKRNRRNWLLLAAFLVPVAALVILHFFVQPLDVLFESLLGSVPL